MRRPWKQLTVRALAAVLVCGMFAALYPGKVEAIPAKPKPNAGDILHGDPTIEPDLRLRAPGTGSKLSTPSEDAPRVTWSASISPEYLHRWYISFVVRLGEFIR